jgi:hypothetical protein
MSNTELSAARDLIQQRRYAEARALLQTINHPTATQWLAKLDQIDPPTRASVIAPLPARERNRSRVSGLSVFSTLVIVILALVIVYQHVRLNNVIRILDELGDVIDSHASDIDSLSYELDTVGAIARNADRYAHSHGFSDAQLKSEIAGIENPLQRILLLEGVEFTWNTAAFPDLRLETGRDYGLLAQDLALIFPELVTRDSETGFLRVDYEGLIPVLIEAVREQQQQIDELGATLAEQN